MPRIDSPNPPRPGSRLRIAVSDTQAHLAVPPRALRLLARAVLRAQRVDHARLGLALVDYAAIHSLNRAHLDHDWPTDVLTFDLAEPGDPALSGQLVLSAQTAVREARRRGLDPRDELALYVIHGILHLCGHDDADPAAARRMRRRQRRIHQALAARWRELAS